MSVVPPAVRRHRKAALVVLLGLVAEHSGQALAEADAEAGRAVVVGGEHADVTPCFMCHGLDGVGDSAGAFPRLTGQVAFYMYKQLVDYASGARPDDVMAPIAREMTEPQMADVAYYYALQNAPHLPPPAVDRDVLARGRMLAEDGIEAADVPACNLCHGADGTGDPPLFPYLAGQYAPYTELQLQRWKAGVRQNDALDVMANIAAAMSEEDIRAVALYYEWLRPEAGDGESGPAIGASEPGPSGG